MQFLNALSDELTRVFVKNPTVDPSDKQRIRVALAKLAYDLEGNSRPSLPRGPLSFVINPAFNIERFRLSVNTRALSLAADNVHAMCTWAFSFEGIVFWSYVHRSLTAMASPSYPLSLENHNED